MGKLTDIEQFLKESKNNNVYDYEDYDDRDLYLEEPREFTEKVLGAGCIQRSKKRIYDEDYERIDYGV